jgi:hypothetical protein
MRDVERRTLVEYPVTLQECIDGRPEELRYAKVIPLFQILTSSLIEFLSQSVNSVRPSQLLSEMSVCIEYPRRWPILTDIIQKKISDFIGGPLTVIGTESANV